LVTQDKLLEGLPEIDPEKSDVLLAHLEGAQPEDEVENLDQIPDERANQMGELVLSALPVTGEIISAKEAYHAFIAAREALKDDKLGEALLKGGESAMAAIGAIPFLGTTIRLGRTGVKAAEMLFKAFKGKGTFGKLSKANRDKIDGIRKTTVDNQPPLRPDQKVEFKSAADGLKADPGKQVELDRAGNFRDVTGARANREFMGKSAQRRKDKSVRDTDHPPYREDMPVYDMKLRQPSKDEFVRVHGEGNQPRPWIMKKADYDALREKVGPDNLTKALKDKFALPEEPKMVSTVSIPKGKNIRIGVTSKHPTWGDGGGTQYEILGKVKRIWFGKPQPIR